MGDIPVPFFTCILDSAVEPGANFGARRIVTQPRGFPCSDSDYSESAGSAGCAQESLRQTIAWSLWASTTSILTAAASAATETGSVSVDSVDALLADPNLDAVCISSSTSTHCDLIEGAARTGKAVFCEKPIHLDMERADACGAVLAETGVPFQIGFNRRFDPNHGEVRRAARNGEIGRLEQAVISSRDPYPPPLRFLRGSGGIFRDMMVHDFDMARFLFGEEPVEVTAMGSVLFDARCEEFGDVDSAMVVLRMASGALCHVNCSRHCSFGYDQRIELFGERGMLVSANPTRTSIERYTESRDLRPRPAAPLLHRAVRRSVHAGDRRLRGCRGARRQAVTRLR